MGIEVLASMAGEKLGNSLMDDSGQRIGMSQGEPMSLQSLGYGSNMGSMADLNTGAKQVSRQQQQLGGNPLSLQGMQAQLPQMRMGDSGGGYRPSNDGARYRAMAQAAQNSQTAADLMPNMQGQAQQLQGGTQAKPLAGYNAIANLAQIMQMVMQRQQPQQQTQSQMDPRIAGLLSAIGGNNGTT